MMATISRLFRKSLVKGQIYLWGEGLAILLLAVLLTAAMLLRYGVKPQQAAQLIAQKNTLKIEENNYQKLINAPATLAQLDPNLGSLKRLNERVYAQKDVGNLLQLIVQMAKNKNITLAQSEIQTINEGHGGLQQLQVTLPIRTGYVEMRQFIQGLLRQLDGVSVDQISIKRENVAQGQLEARIKLSIWIDVAKQTSRSVSQP